MKRSEINRCIREMEELIRKNGFHLPPFCHWTPEERHEGEADLLPVAHAEIGDVPAEHGVADLVVEVLEIRPDLGLVRLIGGKILGIFPGFRKGERRKRHFAFLLNLLPRRPGGRCSP